MTKTEDVDEFRGELEEFLWRVASVRIVTIALWDFLDDVGCVRCEPETAAGSLDPTEFSIANAFVDGCRYPG